MTMPRVTPYNQAYVIEYLKAHAILLLMSDEVPSLKGPMAAKLFDLVGDMDTAEAYEFILQFEGGDHD